jgi:DNA-binding PucR family transcriptional regulator
MATRPEQLYEDDFYAWTRDQASALRQLADQRWNGPLDLLHLAEEVEDLGSERQNAVISQLERALEHLLKLEHSVQSEPRRQWMISVNGARREIRRRITPAIRSAVEQELGPLYGGARRDTALALMDYGEADAARALPDGCPYALDDLLADDWWPANGHGLKDDEAG